MEQLVSLQLKSVQHLEALPVGSQPVHFDRQPLVLEVALYNGPDLSLQTGRLLIEALPVGWRSRLH
jgi:hypothetical protein